MGANVGREGESDQLVLTSETSDLRLRSAALHSIGALPLQNLVQCDHRWAKQHPARQRPTFCSDVMDNSVTSCLAKHQTGECSAERLAMCPMSCVWDR